jgi:hypothetical protein
MGFKVRNNLSGFNGASSVKGGGPSGQKTSENNIGKVFGVVLDENTPSREAFDAAGGWDGIGTVYYKNYDSSKNEDVNDFDVSQIVSSCISAKPLDPSNQNYPLLGELIHVISNPSPVSQVSGVVGTKYYISIINFWNNVEQNAPNTEVLGKTFTKNDNIRRLLSFEGDKIILGRKGNGIRFGSTVSDRSNINEWSSIGKNGDPITILVNGYINKNIKSSTPNVEEINKEMSSIYMTSTQKIPLQPESSINNPIYSFLPPTNYTDSQIILNSDRITLNSKKDEVLLFAKTNIGLNTNNNITLNTKGVIHLNANSQILLGTTPSNTAPTEPVLLGDQTVILLEQIIVALRSLGGYLSSAVSTKPGDPIPGINSAGRQLLNSLEDTCDQLEKIKSKKVFTV